MGATRQSYKLKSQQLDSEEFEFIQACLLGDGTLSAAGKHFRLRVAQKAAHKDYVYGNMKTSKGCVFPNQQ